MDEEITRICDKYKQGAMDRREFIKKLSVLTGSVAAAHALLPELLKDHAEADIVPKDDPRLQTEDINYPGETGDIQATLAMPKGEEELPGVVVIHENRGLNPHIEDVGRRVALEGFLTVAPDALSPFGGTPADENQARDLIGQLNAEATAKNFVAAVQYLKTHPRSTGKIGVMGFCWGGGMTNQVAVNSPDLNAAVPFYGDQPASEDVLNIKAPMLLHYASLDDRINAGIPAFEAALRAAGVEYQLYMYEGANHAFFNDTNTARYNKEAAELAWERTIAFFKDKLGAQPTAVNPSPEDKIITQWGKIK